MYTWIEQQASKSHIRYPDSTLTICIVDQLFHACEIEEDESPPVLKVMQTSPRSQESLDIASGWLKECLENHGHCIVPDEARRPPKRLIDVGSAVQDPFLVQVSPDSRQIQWLSLSYQWGERRSRKLTMETMCDLTKAIPMSTLDRTIQDAIFVARALKIPYIWVDALCIVQGGDEWNEEASRMNEIYGGSVVTLIAAISASVAEGFLTERQLPYITLPWPHVQRAVAETCTAPPKVCISPPWDAHEDILRGPWSSRGWTMQEGLLPNRLLTYTSSQMIWECCEEQRYERGVRRRLDDVVAQAQRHSSDGDISFGSGWLWKLDTFMKFKTFPAYLPSNRDCDIFSASETFRLWYDLVEEYSPRRFTNPTDRLLALSGLAKIFGDQIRCRDYVAGLWGPDLIRGLMWHIEGAALVSRSSPERAKLREAGFPSWSWASAGYEVVKNRWKGNSSMRTLAQAEFAPSGCSCDSQAFGTVSSCCVVLNGPLKRVRRLHNPAWNSSDMPLSRLERHLSATVEMQSPGGVNHRYTSPSVEHFTIVQMLEDLHSLDLLVLEPTGQARDGIQLYRRVGILALWIIQHTDLASPELLEELERIENSIHARLSGDRILRTIYNDSDEVMWR
jgi:hypothetical protein